MLWECSCLYRHGRQHRYPFFPIYFPALFVTAVDCLPNISFTKRTIFFSGSLNGTHFGGASNLMQMYDNFLGFALLIVLHYCLGSFHISWLLLKFTNLVILRKRDRFKGWWKRDRFKGCWWPIQGLGIKRSRIELPGYTYDTVHGRNPKQPPGMYKIM